jgi:hypothetical protein
VSEFARSEHRAGQYHPVAGGAADGVKTLSQNTSVALAGDGV